MSTDTLTTLLQALDEKASNYSTLNRYYAGEQPLTFLAPEIRASLNNRLSRVSVNVPRLLVDSLVERLRITGFSRPDVWPDWVRNDLDERAAVAHREALVLGDAFGIVWADPAGGPRVTVESAQQVTVATDPASRRITAALKRVESGTSTTAWLYLPDRIERYVSNSPGATTTGFKLDGKPIDNPLGVVPVVRFRNGGRLLDDGVSEMNDVLSLTDAIVKLSTDLLTASEYAARPRRWATGVELVEADILDPDTGQPTGATEEVNPFAETDRMLISEEPTAKFGQLSGTDLAGYENAIGVLMRQISAVSGLPEHMLGIGGDNPTSADSIRASEAALTAKAEARQAAFGKAWEDVARLMLAVRDGVDPAGVEVQVKWADPSTRSMAQEADAVVKLHAAGILPTTYALARLGYSDDEVAAITAARRIEALTGIGATLTGLV